MSDELPPDVTPDEVEALKLLAKEELRKRSAALRRALSSEARAERAQAMCERLIALDSFAGADVISAYVPLRFEIDPGLAVERARKHGRTIALPRVDPATRELTLHRYEPADELEESAFAVREPLVGAPKVDPLAVDVVLVPGLAFDLSGHRLGYGQGFYDRLLPRTSRAQRIALAFDFQLLAEVPTFPHDVPVDYVVTDRRVLRCRQ